MFALTGRNLPSVRSYAQALEVYERAHKGTHKEWRGLNKTNKRDSSKLVCRRGDEIVFRYHHTELITWCGPKDVRIEFHSSQSTSVFLSAFTPAGLDPVRSRDVLFMRTAGDQYWCDNASFVDFTFSDEENCWKPNLAQVREFEQFDTDLKAAARVRKLFRSFLEWKTGMERLGTVFFPSDRNLTTALFALKDWVVNGIPEEHYRTAAQSALGDNFLRSAYVLSGAVKKTKAPLGSLPRQSPYTNLAAWSYI